MPNFAEHNFESTSAPAQATAYSPALVHEGYPGMPGAMQPQADNGNGETPNTMLSQLSKQSLIQVVKELPQGDGLQFVQGLPSKDVLIMRDVIAEGKLQPGADKMSSLLGMLPKADLVDAISQLPTDHIATALAGMDGQAADSSLPQLTVGQAADSDAATGTNSTDRASTPTVAQSADVSASALAPNNQATGADASVSPMATSPAMGADAAGAAYNPALGADAAGGAATNPATPTDATTAANPATPTDATTAANPANGVANNSTGVASDTAGGATAADKGLSNAMEVTPADLGAAFNNLTQADVAAFMQALPANDQSALQTALAGNQNPSATDIGNALKQLPENDLNAAIAQVPDISAYFASGDHQATHQPNWQKPMLYGTGGLASLAALGYYKHKTGHFPFLKGKTAVADAVDGAEARTSKVIGSLTEPVFSVSKAGEAIQHASAEAAAKALEDPLGTRALSGVAKMASKVVDVAKWVRGI